MSKRRSLLVVLFCVASCKGSSSAPPSITIGAGKGDSPASATLELVAGQLGAKGSADGVADQARFQLPNGLAQIGAYLYTADLESGQIRRIDLGSGSVTTVPNDATSTDHLVHPAELATDGGLLYVLDNQTYIRRVDVDAQTVTTVAQIPTPCTTKDGLFIAATSTSVYLSDQCSDVVRRFDLAGATWSVLAGVAGMPGFVDGDSNTARFARLQGIALDPAGALYVIDGSSLRSIDPSGTVATIGGAPAIDSSSVLHLAFVDTQTPIYTDEAKNTIVRFDLTTGALTTLAGGQSGNVDGTQAQFATPAGIATDGFGNVYVADSLNNSIRALSLVDGASGSVSTLAGRGQQSGSTDGAKTDARFRAPEAITTDQDGVLYVADALNHAIRRIDPSGNVTTLAGTGSASSADGTGTAAGFNHPGGIAADADHVYVSDTNNQTIRSIVMSTGVVTTLAGQVGTAGAADGVGSSAQFRRPKGLAYDSGRLFVADAENNLIRQIDLSTGVVSTLAGAASLGGTSDGVGADARFFWPFGVRADGHGSLYVADTYNRLIRKVEIATGRVTTLAGSPGTQAPWSVDGNSSDARFNYPVDVAPDANGHLYIADLGNDTLRMLALDTGLVTTVLGTAGSAGVQLSAGGLNWPASLTAGADGSLVILDQRENAVLRLH